MLASLHCEHPGARGEPSTGLATVQGTDWGTNRTQGVGLLDIGLDNTATSELGLQYVIQTDTFDEVRNIFARSVFKEFINDSAEQ